MRRCRISSFSRSIPRRSMPTTRPWRANSAVPRLTPAPAVRDTFAVFCKGMIG